MKVYITKYALTSGIEELDAEPTGLNEQMIELPGHCHYAHGEGKDWHRTRAGAVAKANKMLDHKLASLKKQVAALERERFS